MYSLFLIVLISIWPYLESGYYDLLKGKCKYGGKYCCRENAIYLWIVQSFLLRVGQMKVDATFFRCDVLRK